MELIYGRFQVFSVPLARAAHPGVRPQVLLQGKQAFAVLASHIHVNILLFKSCSKEELKYVPPGIYWTWHAVLCYDFYVASYKPGAAGEEDSTYKDARKIFDCFHFNSRLFFFIPAGL